MKAVYQKKTAYESGLPKKPPMKAVYQKKNRL
jgi:hypothetical protein